MLFASQGVKDEKKLSQQIWLGQNMGVVRLQRGPSINTFYFIFLQNREAYALETFLLHQPEARKQTPDAVYRAALISE